MADDDELLFSDEEIARRVARYVGAKRAIDAGYTMRVLATAPNWTPRDQLYMMRLAYFAGAESVLNVVAPSVDRPTKKSILFLLRYVTAAQAEIKAFNNAKGSPPEPELKATQSG